MAAKKSIRIFFWHKCVYFIGFFFKPVSLSGKSSREEGEYKWLTNIKVALREIKYQLAIDRDCNCIVHSGTPVFCSHCQDDWELDWEEFSFYIFRVLPPWGRVLCL